MRWDRVVFSVIGTLAIGVAVAVAFVDGVGETLVGPVSGFDPPVLLIGAGFGIVGIGAFVAWMVGFGSDTAETVYEAAIASPPEEPSETHAERSATTARAELADARAGDPDAMASVVRRLRETAVSIYAVSAGVTRDDARLAVVAGTWTDDRIAAATLADDKPQPLAARLRLWLDPDRERERRIERTIEAIKRLEGENSDR